MNIIRTEILDNAQRAKDTMVENANSTLRPLTLQKHDYVFLHNENVHKLQNQYSGPFVVHNIPSAHTVLLKDPVTNKIFDSSVHINRVKKAIVREPTPSDFFNVVSSRQIAQKDQSCQTESVQLQNQTCDSKTRPQRQRQPPIRYRDGNHVNPTDVIVCDRSSDSDDCHKIKKVIGQKYSPQGLQYLIQVVDEPADNAFWVTPA